MSTFLTVPENSIRILGLFLKKALKSKKEKPVT
jgi:hypothetical protein